MPAPIDLTTLFLLALLCVVSILSKLGLLNGFISASVGLTVCSWLGLDAITSTLICVVLYTTSFFCGSMSKNDINIALNRECELDAASSLLYTVLPFLLAALIPVGKPPFLISGLFSLPLMTWMVYKNREVISSYRLGRVSNRSINRALLCVAIQSTLYIGVLWAFNRYSDSVMPILGIIAASAIPRLLASDINSKGQRGKKKVKELDYVPYTPSINLASSILAVGLVWVTPGYSSSSISQALFNPGKERAIMSKALEGGVEGYVIGLMLTNQVSGKSPLGDISQSHLLNFSTYSLPSWFWLAIVGCILVSIACSVLLPDWSKTIKVSRYAQAAVLVCQAAITTGSWVLLFLLAGLLCHIVNLTLCPKEDYQNLSILTPMLF